MNVEKELLLRSKEEKRALLNYTETKPLGDGVLIYGS